MNKKRKKNEGKRIRKKLMDKKETERENIATDTKCKTITKTIPNISAFKEAIPNVLKTEKQS